MLNVVACRSVKASQFRGNDLTIGSAEYKDSDELVSFAQIVIGILNLTLRENPL